jgi:Putative DNA-binding domain
VSAEFTTISDLESLCINGVAEGLQIEFKIKEDASTAVISKTDKKNIAEAVSSFANSDGGTVIFGVRSQRQGSADVATGLVPISNISEFEANFRTICSLNVSPSLADIVLRAIRTPDSADGFLVCEVARSERRPHMSTAPGVHTYFRRSFEGNVPMTPSEVRDQILAVRDAVLEPIIRIGGTANYTNNGQHMSAVLSLMFLLENRGRTLCKNPFMRVRSGNKLLCDDQPYDPVFDGYKTDFPYGTLIHVGDEIRCLRLRFSAIVDFLKLKELFDADSADLTEAVIMLPYMDPKEMITVSDKASLDSLLFEVSFGAENAPIRTEREQPSRVDLARSFLNESTVQDMYLSSFSPWRRDLVERFRSQSPGALELVAETTF